MKWPVLFIFSILSFLGQAQNSVLDKANAAIDDKAYDEALVIIESGIDELGEDGRPIERADLMMLKGKAQTHLYKIDDALESYKAVASIGEAVKDTMITVRGLNAMCVILEFRGATKGVVQHCQRVIELSPKETSFISDAYTMIGVVFGSTGKLKEAERYFHLAISLDSLNNDTKSLPFNYGELANLMAEQGRNEEALNAYLTGISYLRTEAESFKLASFYLEISDLFLKQVNVNKAREYALKALEASKKNGLGAREALSHYYLGLLAIRSDSLEEAKNYLEQALYFHKQKNFRKEVISDQIELTRIAHLQGRSAEVHRALDTLEKGLGDEDIWLWRNFHQLRAEVAFAEGDLNIAEVQLKAADELLPNGYWPYMDLRSKNMWFELKKAQGNWQEAFSILEEFTELKDSLFHREQDRTVNELEARFDKANKEKEIADLNTEKIKNETALRQKNFQIWASTIGVFIAVLIILLVVRQYRTGKRLNAKLAEKNEQVEKALDEKELLLKEIHHRVKNNLQVVSSLLSLQSRKINDEKAKEAIMASRNRVKSMALIHQNLYKEDDLTGIDVADYVEKLASSLLSSYQVDQEKVTISTQVENMSLDVDTTIPIGLILNELITNALKYAFPDGRSGAVNISLKQKNGELHLEVKDDGVGYDPKAERGEESSSFGFNMINAFSRKLKAEWEVRNDSGTVVSMRISKFKIAS